jgi:polysaccharide pyruvyl transferase WcaK-like protein
LGVEADPERASHYGIMGYYGIANFGDDLMLYLLIEEILRREPDARFTIFMARAGDATRIFAPSNTKMTILPRESLRQLAAAVRKVDVLAWGGGTCLHERGFCNLNLTAVARGLRKPVVWMGIGAESIVSKASVLKARVALRLCTAITVRDAASYAEIESLHPGIGNLSLAADIAYLLPRSRMASAPPAHSARPLVVSWRTLRGIVDDESARRYLDTIVKALALFIAEKNFASISILNLADVDEEANTALTNALQHELGASSALQVRQVAASTLEEKLAIVRSAGFFFSARLHGFLVAKLLDLPAVGFAYAPKVWRFAEDLTDANALDVTDLEEGAAAVHRILRREADRPAKLSDVRKLEAAALRNVDVLQAAFAS